MTATAPHHPTALTVLTTALGNVTADLTPGPWTRTVRRPTTGQHFEVPLTHETLPADLNQFATNGAWASIEGSPDGRTITLTDITDTGTTLTFSQD